MNFEDPIETRDITLHLLLKHAELNASELAGFVGVSVQAMRRQLRRMEADGLVQSNLKAYGLGRPSNSWGLTRKGHKYFHDGSEKFALGLLGTIEKELSKESIIHLLQQQVSEKADQYCQQIGSGSLEERLKKLLELRRSEGFLPECIPDENGIGWYINEYHCSVRTIAEEYPCLCDQELDILRRVLPDCEVRRVQWRIEEGHSCGFHINLKQHKYE